LKDRLGAGDWVRAGVHAGAGTLVAVVGRAIQAVAAGLAVLALWPTLGTVVTWLKTGAWVTPTPLTLAPETARGVAGSTDWVVLQAVLVWLAGHHVLFTAVPVVAVLALAGSAVVAAGQNRAGRAGDIVSASLADEYRLQQGWARWRPRLLFLLAVGAIAAAGGLVYLEFFAP
jgi:hypothetical protein